VQDWSIVKFSLFGWIWSLSISEYNVHFISYDQVVGECKSTLRARWVRQLLIRPKWHAIYELKTSGAQVGWRAQFSTFGSPMLRINSSELAIKWCLSLKSKMSYSVWGILCFIFLLWSQVRIRVAGDVSLIDAPTTSDKYFLQTYIFTKSSAPSVLSTPFLYFKDDSDRSESKPPHETFHRIHLFAAIGESLWKHALFFEYLMRSSQNPSVICL